MKKYFSLIAFAMVAVFSLVFVSCGDDEEEFEASVVGTWEVTYVRASSYWGVDDDEGFKKGDQMTFYSDGRYEDSEDTGRWSKKGNVLTIDIDDEFSLPAVMTITKLTDKVLEVKLDYDRILQVEMKLKRVH